MNKNEVGLQLATLREQLNQINFDHWQQHLAAASIIFISWTFAPFSYAVGVSGTHFNAHMGMLFLAAYLLAMSLVLFLNYQFRSTLGYLLLAASVVCIIAGFITTPLVMLLLLLMPAFLFIVSLPAAGLQNELGALSASVLLALTVPVGCAYTSLHFISWEIVVYLLPVMAASWAFAIPFFMPQSRQRLIFVTVAVILAVVTIFSRPLHWPTVAAAMLMVGWWAFIAYKKAPEPTMLLTSLTQMLVVVFTYWS